MNRILKNILLGFSAPCLAAMGAPHKFKSAKHYRPEPEPLRFGADGKFRILHLTDIHLVDPEMDDDENRAIPQAEYDETINVIRRSIEMANPDLIVLGGDNISGYWEEFTYEYIDKTIRAILEPIKEKNIPLALVFGNHDGEVGFQTEIQMLMYNEYGNCRSNLNDADVYGCGNCCLTVKSSTGEKDAFSVWLIDSNDYAKSLSGDFGYDCVHADQIAWYEKRSAELKAQNGGEPLPAILFQHMPVQQELDLLKEVPEGTPDSIKCGDKFFSFGEMLISGRLRERPCPPCTDYDSREQLKSWVRCGDVKAAFFGHDHVNDFHIKCEGISLYQTIGAGFFTYGKERGGRLIVLDENEPDNIFTETIEVARITSYDI